MTYYSIQTRDRLCVTGCGFLSFAKNLGKTIGKNISKTFSGKYGQRLLDHANQSATNTLKTTSKRAIQKAAEATGDLIVNKIAKASKTSKKNNSETARKQHDEEIPKERFISPKESSKRKTENY